MKSKFPLSILLIFLPLSFCKSQEKCPHNDIVWMTESIEYAALCEQVYRMAWTVVKANAQAEEGSWAVVLDVDETVLDNSKYAVERVSIDSGYTKKSWAEWERRAEATPIPGVKAFIDSARSLGEKAHIAFITNRDFENEESTKINLKNVGLFQDGDILLTQKGREDTKVDRRNMVETGTGRCEGYPPLKIIALFGDNIRDFMPMWGAETANEYRNNGLPHDLNWGTKYFILPNPNYGSWQRDYN